MRTGGRNPFLKPILAPTKAEIPVKQPFSSMACASAPVRWHAAVGQGNRHPLDIQTLVYILWSNTGGETMDRWTAVFVACLGIAFLGAGFTPSQDFHYRDSQPSAWGALAVPKPVTP